MPTSNKIALFCKTYSADIDRLKNLYNSILQYNVEQILFIVSVPEAELSMFKDFLTQNVLLLSDEEIHNCIGLPGWMQQQTIKLNIHRLAVADNYLVLDADSYFIRPFAVNDFMVNDQVPYTVCHEQKELFTLTELVKHQLGFDPRQVFIEDKRKVMGLIERVGRPYDFGPTPCIWNCELLHNFEQEFVKPNGGYERVLQICPSEITWYGEWYLKTRPFNLFPLEPLFKVYHYPFQYQLDKQLQITEQHLAANYMGIIMQSNWQAPLRY